ncbi:M48 family metallopeptidase [Sphingomonas sp. PAMC 26605]|uniref:M48 family metallopeptidase n=1 Tax=Sphingomonas sp. PAMC 26605 TaxID=1112214 RepID=UPI00026CC61A|nr:M48 family metallopeptidase [Sphingomonas sp. PAMC 26605]
MIRLVAAAVLAGALPAGPIVAAGPPVPPPYAGVYQPTGVDEIGAWKEADESERTLADSPIVIRDEALNAYVRGVLCETVGQDRCKSARIYILRTPIFNANMAPNGTMRVFSGLLLRVRNEAELGTVLGHEFGHFERRHGLSGFKAHRSATDLLSWAAVLSAMSASYDARLRFNDLQLSVYGSFYRFGRDQEREADRLGIGYLNASPLRPQAAATVWRNMIAEAEASSAARGLRKPKLDKVAFFATHPPEAERATTLAALAAPEGATRDDGAQRYKRALSAWLPIFLDDQIKLNDFGGSDFIITALAETGWTAPLWLARGDLYRARGNVRDLVNAAEFYNNAVSMDPALAEAHRGLGLALLKTGRMSDGRAALRRYLALKPLASDASMIGLLATSSEGYK